MNKAVAILLIILVVSAGVNCWIYGKYESSTGNYDRLVNKYNEILKNYTDLQNRVFYVAKDNCTAVTIVYYTNNGKNQQILSLSIPYEKYDAYHKKNHPYWGENNLTSAIEYVSSNETIINQIVETVKGQTKNEEELANALLDLVQDKESALSIRYYPTTELKYPIETLVEMGGDCDTHSFLYGTLMKAAGFKVLLLFSNETFSDGLHHVAAAIHLENPPENSLSEYPDLNFTYNGEEYYYAETTNGSWRVGDLPPKFENSTFNLTFI